MPHSPHTTPRWLLRQVRAADLNDDGKVTRSEAKRAANAKGLGGRKKKAAKK